MWVVMESDRMAGCKPYKQWYDKNELMVVDRAEETEGAAVHLCSPLRRPPPLLLNRTLVQPPRPASSVTERSADRAVSSPAGDMLCGALWAGRFYSLWLYKSDVFTSQMMKKDSQVKHETNAGWYRSDVWGRWAQTAAISAFIGDYFQKRINPHLVPQ